MEPMDSVTAFQAAIILAGGLIMLIGFLSYVGGGNPLFIIPGAVMVFGVAIWRSSR